ncbi:IS110 family transposase [Streptomyces sp. NPDC001312]|uniref:IS110 family transposase n=1 Tax=Streptomyces sp. NPDC001312 TaxID=3364561 RepID=UPI0036BECAFD
MARIWAGTDIGKTHHHAVVLDSEGNRLLSRRVLNDEPELLALLADVLALDEDVVWAVDVADGMAALWVNTLLNHGQQLVYIPGLAVNRACAGYRGTGKTDAKDATVIADQARMRRDLTILRPEDEQVVELRVLTNRRADLVADRTRKINRLRGQLSSIFPALERELELGHLGPLTLLSGYQTPAALRRLGRRRLETWLRNRKVRGAEALAVAALDAAERQHAALLVEETGIGPVTAATVLVAWSHPGRIRNEAAFAALAGVSPLPASSGNTTRHRLNRGGDRRLNRALNVIAMVRMVHHPQTRAYADRRRTEGKTDREIRRCLKRYLARRLYRHLNSAATAMGVDEI